MEITVTGRKKQVSDRFRRHLEEKLDKIPQLAPRVSRADVVLTHEANPRQAKESERVEITCYIKRTVVRAEAAADEDYAALDLAMTRLLERLRRSNDRRRISHTGKHRQPSVAEATFGLPTDPLPMPAHSEMSANGVPMDKEEAVAQALGTEGNSPIELREKVHPSEPMSVGQALNEMELVGHDFYLFHDTETDQPSVVYRRRGWSYGVLRLDSSGSEQPESAGERLAAG
ncbi:ribosome hibernation-promoting factor, HPF/YfiA family [Ornithinimicrobium cavernae]|uniref:ribosome hibernation-promoting factor, HPF/YfiA family n=1 Tax=Ornithinimicrobium cavernae TaxID=2666047 RepID=UPI000D691FD1|nr:ribosome-associated translation inhibitor RaiA [Ornithinimicrobium cavernae]